MFFGRWWLHPLWGDVSNLVCCGWFRLYTRSPVGGDLDVLFPIFFMARNVKNCTSALLRAMFCALASVALFAMPCLVFCELPLSLSLSFAINCDEMRVSCTPLSIFLSRRDGSSGAVSSTIQPPPLCMHISLLGRSLLVCRCWSVAAGLSLLTHLVHSCLSLLSFILLVLMVLICLDFLFFVFFCFGLFFFRAGETPLHYTAKGEGRAERDAIGRVQIAAWLVSSGNRLFCFLSTVLLWLRCRCVRVPSSHATALPIHPSTSNTPSVGADSSCWRDTSSVVTQPLDNE